MSGLENNVHRGGNGQPQHFGEGSKMNEIIETNKRIEQLVNN